MPSRSASAHPARPRVSTLARYLLAVGLSKHYLPERVVTLLPMTPSVKIQKFKLREMIG
jgi:cyclohexanecarboxylate-CoA ligase